MGCANKDPFQEICGSSDLYAKIQRVCGATSCGTPSSLDHDPGHELAAVSEQRGEHVELGESRRRGHVELSESRRRGASELLVLAASPAFP